jgi:hypothetical protein
MTTILRFEDIEAWQLGRELKRLVTYLRQQQFGELYLSAAADVGRKIGAFMITFNEQRSAVVNSCGRPGVNNSKLETRNPKRKA